MKTYIIIATALFFIACDPGIPGFGGTPIEIKAQVINPKDTISFGDSVAFYFEVPDTVDFNGTRVKTFITSKDAGQVNLFPNRIDSATGKIIGNDGTVGYFYANPGVVKNTISLNLSNVNSKLIGKFYFIPKNKGVYFLDVLQDGFVYLNNASIKTDNSFNFGAVDRHHYLVLNNVNPSLNINAFFQDKSNRGLEVYAFYVK